MCTGVLTFPCHAAAQSESYNIKIEATDAVTALNILGLQTEHPLLFNYNQVKNFRVNSLEGNYTLQQALDLILRDTGLSGSLSEREVISISLNTESVTQPKEDQMKFKGTTKSIVNTAASAALLAAISTSPAAAQTDNTAQAEDVVITTGVRTGSRIKRQSDYATPLVSVGQADFSANALKDVRDFVGILPSNNGSENNSDNLTQNFTAGTSNINLRGLGVSSTLVLLNGKRQVLSSAVTNDGGTFVDLSALLPTLAIERAEILKDGASAIYGSDAVAGVANFITRNDFEGAEFAAEYRTRAQEGSQEDYTLDAVIGSNFADGKGHFLIAGSYLDRSGITLADVDFDEPATSGFGNPASFVIPADAGVPGAGSTVADPNCEANGGILQDLGNGSTQCRFDFGPQISFVPNEERLQGFARASYEFNDTTTLWGEVAYARNDISREVSPSFPVLNTPLVPESNPGNPFGADVFFQGRPFGVGSPNEINFFQHNTVRAAIGLEGEFGDDYSWDISYVRAVNDSVQNPRDTIADNFQASLQGFGGESCDTSPTAATPAVAGENGCLFFDPSDPTGNEALRSFIIGDFIADAESTLDVIEANFTGSLFELGGRDVGFAIGAQYRDQGLSYSFDTISQQDGFSFLIGNPNFAGSIDTVAVYGEVLVPVNDFIELSGALRYEDYGDEIGDTIDPKVAVLIRPTEKISLRGSYSTSFRAPSVFQAQGIQTSFVNIADPNNGGSTTFGGNRTVGSPNLDPETSTAFNIGGTWQPTSNIELNVDYWNFSFEDVLAQESAQGIVNADPNDPRIERTSAGTIAIVNTAFINADAIDTSGIDIEARASFDTSFGTFAPFTNISLVLDYDVTTAGVEVDALNRLNRDNVGAPTQSFKGNFGVNYSTGPISANAILRHVGSYEDDFGVDIDSFTTVDVNATYDFGGILGEDSSSYVSVGLVNATGEDPPFVAVSGSYDPRSADPRGRRAFVKVGTKF